MTKIGNRMVKCGKCGEESNQLIVYSVNYSLGEKKSNDNLINHKQKCAFCGYEAPNIEVYYESDNKIDELVNKIDKKIEEYEVENKNHIPSYNEFITQRQVEPVNIDAEPSTLDRLTKIEEEEEEIPTSMAFDEYMEYREENKIGIAEPPKEVIEYEQDKANVLNYGNDEHIDYGVVIEETPETPVENFKQVVGLHRNISTDINLATLNDSPQKVYINVPDGDKMVEHVAYTSLFNVETTEKNLAELDINLNIKGISTRIIITNNEIKEIKLVDEINGDKVKKLDDKEFADLIKTFNMIIKEWGSEYKSDASLDKWIVRVSTYNKYYHYAGEGAFPENWYMFKEFVNILLTKFK